MSAQLKTHLAVRSSGRENDWLGYACSTLNSQYCESQSTKNTVFLGFKLDSRFLRILKLLHIYLFGVFRGGSSNAGTSKMEVNYYHKVLHLGCFSITRVVDNRATQDTFWKSQGNKNLWFLYTLFEAIFILLRQ